NDWIVCSTIPSEEVPTALAIGYYGQDPHKCAVFCANIGGDTDTIGAIATAICGAKSGYSEMKTDWVQTIDEHNDVNLHEYAKMLETERIQQNWRVSDGK